MNLEIRADGEAPDDWNKNLLLSNMGTIHNTVEYSNYTRNRLNWKPNFLSIINSKGKILSQVIIFEIPASIKGKKIPQVLNNLTSKKFQTITWNFGPVIFSDSENVLSEFFKYIKKWKKFHGYFHPFFDYELPESSSIKKWATFIINLQESQDKIKNAFDKKSVVKNIQRSRERGVKISKIDDKSIEDYAKLLQEYRIQNNTETYSKEQVIDFWNYLKPTGLRGYLAFKDSEIIGGITFSTFNGYLNEWGIARSQRDMIEKLYSQDLLKWKIIEWGIQNNQKFFDLTGFNPNPTSEKEKGILQYKKKWGGKKYDMLLFKR